MSESEELKAFKKRLDAKYGRLAKKRLADISDKLATKKQVVDMDDDEFTQWLASLGENSNVTNSIMQADLQTLISLLQSTDHNNGGLAIKGNDGTVWVHSKDIVSRLQKIVNEAQQNNQSNK